MEQQIAQGIANGGAARFGALDDRVPQLAQPFGEQPALGRFAGAIDTIQCDEPRTPSRRSDHYSAPFLRVFAP